MAEESAIKKFSGLKKDTGGTPVSSGTVSQTRTKPYYRVPASGTPFSGRSRQGRGMKGKGGDRRNGAQKDVDRKVISIRRVAKVNAGSKRLRFSAVVVSGDRKGKVGIGLGRGADTRLAIDKAAKYASSHLVRVDILGDTIPHEVEAKFRAAKVLIKPAGPGTGVIASSAVRSVMEMAGVRNVLTKQLGCSNPIVNAYCTLEALKTLSKGRIVERRIQRQKNRLDTKLKSKNATKQTEETKK